MAGSFFKTAPTENKPKGRWRFGRIYLILLALSFLWQTIVPWVMPGKLDENEKVARVTEMNREGPIAGREDSVQIAYQTFGDPNAKQTVIMLHGSPTGGHDFTHLGPMLGEKYHVIAPLFPGFGNSERWVRDYSIKAGAHYTFALMDQLGIDRAHVLGYSQGSGSAIHMADLHPDRVQSVTLYGGIGVQEGEGSGNYHFEHFKYALGYVFVVALPEVIPHFGWLGDRSMRYAFISNFWDTDQRPVRAALERMNENEMPLLILHGKSDFLVPANTARMHHAIVEHSELVMFDAGHIMVFNEDDSRLLADEIVSFVDRYTLANDAPPTTIRPTLHPRRTVDPFAEEQPDGLAADRLGINQTMGPWEQFTIIALATWVLEDLACVSTGMLIRNGQIDYGVGAIACFIGIWAGDFLLWLAGHFFIKRILHWKYFHKRLPPAKLKRFAEWFDRKGWIAVIASRFIPGTRLPLYLAAGASGHRPIRFMLWTLVAITIWVPFILIATVLLGNTFAAPFEAVFGSGWVSLIVMVLFILVMIEYMPLLLTRHGRPQIAARIARIRRHEFWSPWVFYAPLGVWLFLLSLRYRSATVWMLANPSVPVDQVIYEHKSWVNEQLPAAHRLPGVLIRSCTPDDPAARTEALKAQVETNGWSLPIVLKPECGCRGTDVARIDSLDEARAYFESCAADTFAQVHCPHANEVGIFYVRELDTERGRIFAFTLKEAQFVAGDGESTFEELVLADHRLRMQYDTFAAVHADLMEKVIPEGERIRMAFAGNHAQGTIFRDGGHLITPALTETIEKLAQSIDDFYFGRFDLMYEELKKLENGEDFAIVELNLATSEATNLYDPDWSLRQRYRLLFEQWRLAYAIGQAHRRARNLRPPGLWKMLTLLRAK